MSVPARVPGNDSVKEALVSAAAEMLGEVGPRALSVRNIANRAGVNHGQVHHYFGGKRGLLEAAMRHLALGHYEHSLALAGGAELPPALSLAEDTGYWRAVCQVVMDGDLALARIEVDEDISVPRRVLSSVQQRLGASDDDLALKARFAAMAAMQLGWVAFEDFMLLLADVPPEQRETLRDHVGRFMQEAVDDLLG